MFVYLDNSATTRQRDEVTEVMLKMMKEEFGNPSSMHGLGFLAEKSMKESRRSVAASLGAEESEIFFTSGGTESDNTAIFGAAEAKRREGMRIITSQVEHPAVLESYRRLEKLGFETVYIGVDGVGRVRLDELEQAIDEHTGLISIMHVNNELGTIEPLEEIGILKKKAEAKWGKKILFHADAVQSYGKVPLKLAGCNVDLLSLSGHKIHGPKGIGALYVKKGVHIPSFFYGGGQESGFRSGTENVPGIAGLSCAVKLAFHDFDRRMKRMEQTKDYLQRGIEAEIKDIQMNSPKEGCSPAILNVSFLGCKGEVLLHTLEQKNIYVSTGSACSSKKKGSHVLFAAGLSKGAIEGALRFSLCEENTEEQMDYTIEELKKAVTSMRRLHSAFRSEK